ncbi:iron complex outermembrane recepter protein [Algoriphagus locisalis]|uniref:Iron complex outermembrane recepter protein n=1 Tax=Algoriphagus locisalis TaxID=305507 RepID=A0A1I7DU40_9BACT|nr:TonB-dependent receptor plug domain-containing protein [Algoriphagus locisalis]SFU15126.1 iron complex outermembrane recepter protein [Algoriphagus locisalis]
MTLLLWVYSFVGFSPISQDTIPLAEVEVYAPALDRFAQGQKVISWSKKDLQDFQGRSLGDILQEQSPVFVRQYGAGMIASPSFRGTSAGHTAVFWNGLPINSPSLGQSDLSILPVSAIDQVSLQFGNAGALFGNEAIGGSVHLGTESEFGKGFHAGISQQIGSFGLFNSSAYAGFSTSNFSSKTKIYREFAKNNFPYKDLGQFGTPEVKEDHAQFEQIGIVQDLAWNLNDNNQLKTAFWWNKTNREVQPVIGSNTEDEQEDQAFRAVIDYFHFEEKSIWNLKTGFVRNEQLFNSSQNNSTQYFLAGDWDQEISTKWTSKLGARYTLTKGDLSTYQAEDNRIELYQSTNFSPSEKLSFALNLRQLVYDGTFAPFTPNLGMDWSFWNRNSQSLQLKTSLGKGFKVPTLNDRFWNPGGNPELLPEESLSGEIALTWNKTGNLNWKQSLTYYKMSVDNWIIWLPKGSFWTPENIKKVSNQGVEYQGNLDGKFGMWNWELTTSYTFSKAITSEAVDENDQSVGKQLPYSPQHQANAKIRVEIQDFSAFASTFYVGERSVTADNPRLIPSYQLYNLGLGYSGLQLGEIRFPLSFQINNILDTDYQVLYLRAMPGRSFQFNLSILL